MNLPADSKAQDYDAFDEELDSSLMRQLRVEAYGEDIGQRRYLETVADISRPGAVSRMMDLAETAGP